MCYEHNSDEQFCLIQGSPNSVSTELKCFSLRVYRTTRPREDEVMSAEVELCLKMESSDARGSRN